MDKLRLMAAFVAVAEEEGFAAGGRRLGMSAPATTRAVATLEESLGAKLLKRTTRAVRLTDAGQGFLGNARRILADVAEAEASVGGLQGQLRGPIVVTAPVLFGKMFVLPAVLDFLQQHSGVKISVLLLDRIVNLLEEDVDVGVRIGSLADSSMKAIRVGEVSQVVCASPAYLKKHGRPRSPDQLCEHQLVAATGVTSATEWHFDSNGRRVICPIRPRLVLTSNDAALDAAVSSFGITRLLSYQVNALVKQGRLGTLLDDWAPPPVPVHIVHREGRYPPARTRLFIDHLAAKLRAR
jgi:DNA-binding transcriptional LysR family regulator